MTEGESPLGQALQRLALVQESTTALQRQQSEALLVIASSQREDRALLRELLQRPAAREAEPVTNPARPPQIALQKMSADDDPEAYLDIFEGTAAACGWPEEEWAVRLLPLLAGAAQLAAHSLPASDRHEYKQLRRAILDRLGSTPEGHRRRFRALPFEDAGRPFSYAKQLLDAARRWLQPGMRSAEDVMEQVALEQFVAGLPSSTANWVQCHRPASLEAAVVLAEDHLSLPRRSMKEEPRQPVVPADRPVPAPRRRFPTAAAAPRSPQPTTRPLPTQALPHLSLSLSLSPGSSLRLWSSGTTGGSSGARAGVLAVRAARPLPAGVSHDGGRTVGPGCGTASCLPRFRRDVPYTGMYTGGYPPGSDGHGL
ncbi:hypothetical protein PBY51_023920 [Eleginops maclovinus]|uniref:SCAN box domain-containing protein n=1 Tax=Eleginops maclovinus TaxID=56733 RepID=A0AAN7WZP3_ELEMC|nr:hypothetical protein PBY51_023920 [Eleginops maclovinus]